MAGGVGLLAAAGARLEGQTIGVFETHPDLLGPQPQSLTDHLLANRVVARTDIRYARQNIYLRVLFERNRRAGFSLRRASFVKRHAPAAIFPFITLLPS